MILSPNRSSRGGKQVKLIILHTAEGARTVESLGAFFSRTASQVSSHAGVDDQRVETYVPYNEMSWTVLAGNPISENVELCGFAAWTRDQWLAEHRRMLELTAGWIAERCRARNIPIRKLTPAELAAGQSGVIGHVDWTVGMRQGTHTDPGPGFPWDVVMQLAQQTSAPAGPNLTCADVLTAHGILRAPEVVELAATAGLELAAATTMLEKESAGGNNVWGHDGVVVAPGTYVKGAEVTQVAYEAYKAAVKAGKAGRQGCGPTQLTWGPYQDQADSNGGCWDWRANVTVGFGVLAAAIAFGGVRTGFRAYNGPPGSKAEGYADDAMTRYNIWRTRLADATTPPDTTLGTDDDMNDQDRAMLTAVYQQLSGSPKFGEWPGWQTWGGGTDEHLTLVDLARRNNVEVRQTWLEIKALRAEVETLQSALQAIQPRA